MNLETLFFTAAAFLIVNAVLLAGCRILSGEKWQIMASIPIWFDNDSGFWHGVNLTYYGALLANGTVLGTSLFIVLTGTAGIAAEDIFFITLSTITASTIAAKLVARIVEKKKATFTVAGSAFTGLLITPIFVWLYGNFTGRNLSTLILMSALAVGYAFGEGFGRLGCISFGCCYGKPVSQMEGLSAVIFKKFNMAFYGSTKKIAYESGLEGIKVVPVQAMSVILYVNTGIIGALLFLYGHFVYAFLICTLVTFGWRIIAEFLRADYRGAGSFSAYQKMATVCILFSVIFILFTDHEPLYGLNLVRGLENLWQPETLLLLQFLWLFLFIFTGISRVTGSRLKLHLKGYMI